MRLRITSQLVNGFVAVMLLSACAGSGQDQKPIAVAAAKPAVKTVPQEQPILPRLKPKTPKKAPASPKLTEDPEPDTTPVSPDDAAAAPAGDSHQQVITNGTVLDPQEKDDSTPDTVAALPTVPSVIKADPEPVGAATPEELKSKAENDVERLLGRPVATRSEGTGTVWTYRTEMCSLDVYFFLDVADNKRRALSYEMMPAWTEDDATQSCYKALKTAHHVQ